MRTERIEMLEQLNRALSFASDTYEEAWIENFQNPSPEAQEKLDVAGMLVDVATNKWLDALA